MSEPICELTFDERRKLEKLFDMGCGYVLSFSNSTFQEFVAESTGKNIYDVKYDRASGSKANRLRAFWSREPNHVVGKLITALVEQCQSGNSDVLREECRRIAERLLQGTKVEDIDAIVPNSEGREFDILAKSVREAIERNEPESGIDRLHTFVVKYVRTLCKRHGLAIDEDKPLHGLFGEYVKRLKQRGLIESEMTERILKSSIAIMEAFNHVRNRRSLAHDNQMLNHSESLLVLNYVASTIRFIRTVESAQEERSQPADQNTVTGSAVVF